MPAITIGPTWQKANNLWINTGPPRQYEGPVFVISSNNPPNGSPAGVWQRVDLTQPPWNVGHNAFAAFLAGICIITGGTTPEIDEFGVIFRAPGDTRVGIDVADFIGQSVFQVNAGDYGGQRSAMATWVPVIGGNIEYAWMRNTTDAYPSGGAYGFNLSVQAWVE